MAVGDGHNDIVMMALVLLAAWLLLRKRWAWSAAALALSAGVKIVSLAFIPLAIGYALGASRRVLSGGQDVAAEPGRIAILGRGLLATIGVGLLMIIPAGGLAYVFAEAQRLLHPDNWQAGMASVASLAFSVGLALFALAYGFVALRLFRAGAPRDRTLESLFLVSLLAFVFGAARAQPWHLIWPLSLAGLVRWAWAWPVTIGLSAVFVLAQLWVEWGMPGLGVVL
jgi:hypothetical protein